MRKSILALAAVSAMLFALPAVASAESWQIHPANVAFTMASGATLLTSTSGDTFLCTSSTGLGKYVSNTTAEGIKLRINGCKGGSVACHGSKTTGTIETNEMVAHNVWANKHGARTRALLLTPVAGKHIATYSCTIFGIGPTITLTGSIVGEVGLTKSCNTPALEAHLNFGSESSGHQTIKTLWNTAGTYDLTADKEGVPSTESWDGTLAVKFSEEATITC
jgi:hypothetical protein